MTNSSAAAPAKKSAVSAQAFVIRPSAGLELARPIQGESSPIPLRAEEQFAVFESRLRAAGRGVVAVEAPPGTGPAVADLAVLTPKGAILMRPSDFVARRAVAALEIALGKAGIPVAGGIEAPGLLDGGDVLLGWDRAYVGVPAARMALTGVPRRERGNELGRKQFAALAATLGYTAVEVAVSADVPRLRSVAAVAGDVLIASDLVDAAAFGARTIVRVERGEDYAAGVLSLGPRRVIANVRFREAPQAFRKAGLIIDAIDLWEFGKIGVTPSLLALLSG
jgi:N-dimethylarginine dimethylaminohydrolase